jgi:AcrR family transcriptional regulator
MARIVKEHAVRRNEILDVAQRLVYTKGYEQMSIQDILDDLQIAKGTFYHYFASKQALLEAIIERLQADAGQLMIPIAYEPSLPALEKLQRIFATLGRWKTTRKDFLLVLLRIWYTDENAIVSKKARVAAINLTMPLLTAIIQQGIEEGTFTTPYPDQAGSIVFSLIEGIQEILARAMISSEPGHEAWQRVGRAVAAYDDAIERVLGLPSGSVCLTDAETLKEWFVSSEGNP